MCSQRRCHTGAVAGVASSLGECPISSVGFSVAASRLSNLSGFIMYAESVDQGRIGVRLFRLGYIPFHFGSPVNLHSFFGKQLLELMNI